MDYIEEMHSEAFKNDVLIVAGDVVSAAEEHFEDEAQYGTCLLLLLQGVQEIANSYVDQQQESKERRDVIVREERRLEKRNISSSSSIRKYPKVTFTQAWCF